MIFKNFKSAKKFCSKNDKIAEAKKRAMKIYDDIILNRKVNSNRDLEEKTILNKNVDDYKDEIKSFKSEKFKEKISNLVDNFEFVDSKVKSKENQQMFKSIEHKIFNEVFIYKFPNKENIIDNEWLRIYEFKIDEKFDKFKRLVKNLILVFIVVLTLKIIKKRKRLNKLQILTYSSFYLFALSLFFINRAFSKQTVKMIYLNYKEGDKLKIFMHDKKKQNFFVLDIINLFSITSRKENLHELLFYNSKNKIQQIFLNKKANYDVNLISNIAHPKVRKVKFSDY